MAISWLIWTCGMVDAKYGSIPLPYADPSGLARSSRLFHSGGAQPTIAWMLPIRMGENQGGAFICAAPIYQPPSLDDTYPTSNHMGQQARPVGVAQGVFRCCAPKRPVLTCRLNVHSHLLTMKDIMRTEETGGVACIKRSGRGCSLPYGR